ncbi:Vacuolar protein sorting-associated protein 8, central domain [Dillenia turbinata]|uniref:Vacuolar protein sorting-associated protein 8, central domain n=1 Tax=Dillenia turbinata TaxID=194707 RepID=A0AAN8UWH4_9MAGN
MTNKKQTRATIPPMDLDLDSFLQTHSSSDDDDDRIPHRTVDEILNDSDSSSSSSSPSSPTSSLNRAYLRHKPSSVPSPHNDDYLKLKSSPDPNPNPSPKDDEDASVSSQETITEALKTTTPDRTATNKVNSSKPAEFLGPDAFSLARRFSLLGGIRSNAKPGAALAAAAAASRSVPTPHAAAIKSRRAAATTTTTATAAITKTTTSHEGLLHAVRESDAAVGAGDTGSISDMDEFHSSHVDTGTAANATDSAFGVDALTEAALASDAGHLRLDNSADVVLFDPIMPSSSSVERRSFMTEESLNSDENADKSAESSVVFEDKIAEPFCGEMNASRADPNSTSSVAAGFAEQGGPNAHEDGEIDGSSSAATAFATGVPVPKDGEMSVAAADDAIELVEEMMVEWESKRDNKRVAKKSRPSMKPLELAEELEKKHASTGLHWEEGAAAQPMRLEGVRRGSIALGYLDISSSNTTTRTISSPAFKRDHGSPQVLAVHSNFIAVGFSKGIVVVLPSKYSAQSPDNMEGKMLMLGLHGDKTAASVTSMCFNQQGDLLLAGYGDGHVTVWDLQRAVAAKVISGEHTAPVVHTLFLGQDSQVTRQFKAVTGDSKGLVLLHAFSVVPLLNRFSIKTQCLLDGQKTGIVLSASPLLLDDFLGGTLFVSPANAPSASGIGSMMGGVVGGDAGWKLFSEGSSLVEEGVVIFATHQTALVVRLSPSVEVYAQLSKPDGVREGSMPYTAWKNVSQAHGSSAEGAATEASERVSLLAIAWDRKVQVAKLVKSALKVYGKWTLDSAAIGVAWLDDQMLVVLTLVGQLCLFTKDGSLIHQTSFSLDGYKGDDLVAYHTYFTNIFGNPEKAYHNCVAVRGATVYVLGPMHLIVSRLLPWKERIQVLRKSGDWMGALNMAMTLFDGNAHGVIDLPRSVDSVQEAIMPYLVELLLAYVDEVFSYISVAFCNQIGKLEQLDEPKSRSSSVHSEIKEQFTRVGGVAVEFCVHIKRNDILFDEIFSKFVAVQQRGTLYLAGLLQELIQYHLVNGGNTFLELLEPYILKDMLGSLPPEVFVFNEMLHCRCIFCRTLIISLTIIPKIMQALVEHYSSKGWLQRVEQCVLHMDISSLDFNQVVRLCREHGLYGALIYLFNQGLDDFKAPLEELLAVFQNSQKESAATLGYVNLDI